MNGCLVITDNETGELIGRKDEFVHLNMIIHPEHLKRSDKKIDQWREIAEERRKNAPKKAD